RRTLGAVFDRINPDRSGRLVAYHGVFKVAAVAVGSGQRPGVAVVLGDGLLVGEGIEVGVLEADAGEGPGALPGEHRLAVFGEALPGPVAVVVFLCADQAAVQALGVVADLIAVERQPGVGVGVAVGA